MKMFRVKLMNKTENYIDRKVLVKGQNYKEAISKLQLYLKTHEIYSYSEVLI